MQIIHSGGVNKYIGKQDPEYQVYGFGNYFMLQLRDRILELIHEGGSIAICVAAKPEKHHYDQHLVEMGFRVEDFIILGRNDPAEWEKYDAILLLGGETRALYEWLDRTDFAVKNLHRCQLLAGDSAGAYVLAGKTLIDYEADGSRFEVVDGFIPEIKVLVAAHINNPHYHQRGLSVVLNQWCVENSIEYLELEEDQLREGVFSLSS